MNMNNLREMMSNCEQMTGLTVLQHGEMVAERYFELLAYLREGRPLINEWRLPDWITDPKIIANLLTDDVMSVYLVYHDCGKPACIEFDEEGKRHFPNHAEISKKVWIEAGGSEEVAELIGMDMDIHTLKDVGVEQFAARPQAIGLILAGLCEIHANASLFGGIESTRFKIAWKQIDKRGRAILKYID